MLGLTAICDKIILDAKNAAAEKLHVAESEAATIKSEGISACESLKLQADSSLSAFEATQSERLSALLLSSERDALLKTEHDTISEIIYEAKKQILSFPDAEYFDLLARLFKKVSHRSECELLLCNADKKRMDKKFLTRLGNVTLAKDDAPSEGFIVRCGKIEENCTLDAIFKAEKHRLFDILSSYLKG